MMRKLNNLNDVSGGLIVKDGDDYYVLDESTREFLSGMEMEDGIVTGYAGFELEDAIAEDKKLNPTNRFAGRFYVTKPDHYRSLSDVARVIPIYKNARKRYNGTAFIPTMLD